MGRAAITAEDKELLLNKILYDLSNFARITDGYTSITIQSTIVLLFNFTIQFQKHTQTISITA